MLILFESKDEIIELKSRHGKAIVMQMCAVASAYSISATDLQEAKAYLKRQPEISLLS